METTVVNDVTGAPYEDELELRRYARFVRAYWMVLCACAVAGAVAGLALCSLMPRRFQSTATLLITPQTPGSTPLAMTPAAAKAMLANSTVVAETVAELGLDGAGGADAFIADALDIQPVPATNFVTLSVALPDPAKARAAAQLLAAKIAQLSQRVDRNTASATRAALEKQLNDARAALKLAEEQLAAFQTTAEMERLEAEMNARTLLRAGVESIAIALDSERARLATLQQEFARQSPELDAPLPGGAFEDALRRRSNGAGTDAPPYANPVRTMLGYDIAQSRATIAKLERQRQETLALTTAAATGKQRQELYRRRLELARLQGVYDASTKAYHAASGRFQEAQAHAAAPQQVQVLLAPVQAGAPMPLRRRQFATLGIIIGLVFGIVASLFVDARRTARLRA